jgi:uncharacterized protein
MNITTRVLFLCFGDNQYHDHGKIGTFLNAALRSSGFSVTSATDPGAITPDALAAHDAVVMYAVAATAARAQLDALLETVRGDRLNDRGRPVGFVGLHGVTTSFQDSAEFKRLIGASFLSHPDMGPAYRFKVKDASQPLMTGITDFSLTDELYLFETHERFSVVLFCLYEGVERPVAWHKPYGRGKVFYLALGHDTEQLGDANVRRLIDNGVRWSAAD